MSRKNSMLYHYFGKCEPNNKILLPEDSTGNVLCTVQSHISPEVIGVDPARVRGARPSWNFASEGPPLFGPSQNVWSAVM